MGFFDTVGGIVNAFDVPRKEKRGAYARLIFLGLLGWHEFYLAKTARGVLYIVSFAVLMLGRFLHIPIALYALYAGAGALIVFWLFDLFTLGRQVDKWNAHAGNIILDKAGELTASAISIPLQNACNEYDGVVQTYQNVIAEFDGKKNEVEKLLNKLQKARKDALAMVSKMQQILSAIVIKGTDVRDTLGDAGDIPADFLELLSGDSSVFEELNTAIESSTQEMQGAFNASREWAQTASDFASRLGIDGGKAGAAAAAAGLAITAINEFAKQQEVIAEIKQKREEILARQNEVETKIMQLEATEKRASEILKVINAEIPAFNHIYKGFCANVFPGGFKGKKDIKELTLEQRKMFNDLGLALSKVLGVIKQEIRQD
jgi:TM2 domain-containing membrane protein YozV